MKKVSYHTHSTVSDGALSPRELIEKAIEKGFEVIAITDHYPRPKGIDNNGWSDGFYTDEDYAELRTLQDEYKDRIEVLVGVEFEWYTEKKEWLKGEVYKRDYDIRIISAHQLFYKGNYHTINFLEEGKESILTVFDGDAQKIVACYFKSLREAIGSGWFDVVAHLDLIKSLEKSQRFFSEDEEWYRSEVVKTLELIREMGLKLEVNLQGFFKKVGEQWPSKWIIDEARAMEIELLVGTDAHDEAQLDYDVKVVENLLK